MKEIAQENIQEAAQLLSELEKESLAALIQAEAEVKEYYYKLQQQAQITQQQQILQQQQELIRQQRETQRQQRKLKEQEAIRDAARMLGEMLGGGGSFQPWW